MYSSEGTYFLHHKNLKLIENKITMVTEDRSGLTEKQKFLLDYFDSKTEGKRLAMRSDLKPEEVKSYLPNIVLFDLCVDEKKRIEDIVIRLIGTRLTEFYGELTGLSVANDFADKGLVVVGERFITDAKIVSREKAPLTTETLQTEESIPYINVKTLKIPFSENGEDVDMVFGFIDISSGQNKLKNND